MAGCSGHSVVMLYGVRVEVDTLCLAVLVACCGVCVLDWCAGVQTEVVVLRSLGWSVCSCLLFSESGFLFFFFMLSFTFSDYI